MIVGMFVDDVSAQVGMLHKRASEARDSGDMEGFFNYSQEALELVNGWIDRQQCRMNFKESFESSICRVKNEQDLRIAFNYLKLAVLKVEAGLAEPKFDIKELNKHLMVKAI